MISLQSIIIAIVIAINITTFVLVGYDKQRSRGTDRRVPEVYFFFWSIFFSSFGALAGMLAFHHKTRKWTFVFGIGALALQQLALLYFLLTYK